MTGYGERGSKHTGFVKWGRIFGVTVSFSRQELLLIRELSYILTYLVNYLLTYILTYLITYILT